MNIFELKDLKTKDFGRAFVHLETVESTFLTMREFEKQGAVHGCVVLADEQTLGRGRFSRRWESGKGLGLYFNLLLRPDLSPTLAPRLILFAAVGVAQGLRDLGFEAKIKWPNDIVISGKKVCGMLMESGGDMEHLRYVSAGIGINVNQTLSDFPDELQEKAASLFILSGREQSRETVLTAVLNRLEENYYLCINNYEELSENYTRLSATVGHEVVASGGSEVSGFAEGINEDGELLVRDKKGVLHALNIGDVSVRGVMGYV